MQHLGSGGIYYSPWGIRAETINYSLCAMTKCEQTSVSNVGMKKLSKNSDGPKVRDARRKDAAFSTKTT